MGSTPSRPPSPAKPGIENKPLPRSRQVDEARRPNAVEPIDPWYIAGAILIGWLF